MENYRGIIILSIIAQIFETALNNRIVFASEIFQETDEYEYNGQHMWQTILPLNDIIPVCSFDVAAYLLAFT